MDLNYSLYVEGDSAELHSLNGSQLPMREFEQVLNLLSFHGFEYVCKGEAGSMLHLSRKNHFEDEYEREKKRKSKESDEGIL